MWIVRLALRRPYTVATFCLLILLLGILSVTRMRTDVLPSINIPVVVVVWSYNGLSAEDMERRVTLVAERGYSTTVDNIEHMESESISGIGIIRMYMDPASNIGGAIAQVTAQSMQSMRFMPTGMQPPNILQFNASNVPVAQITMSSDSITAMEIFDYTQNFMRLKLFTIPGLQSPPPYGGTGRQVSVDLDLEKLAAKQLSPQDAVEALLASNVILPAGTVRVGDREYDVQLNSSPATYAEFNRIPIKVVNGATIYLGDVSNVHDGTGVPTNSVHVNGQRATYLAILKKSDASTITVVDAAKEMLPTLRAAAPHGLEVKLDFDQSVFVRASIKGVLREALISGGLVALMILGFLGSWRAVIICCASIPLAIFCGIIGLFLTGNTLNLMTLGGLALAIGMLVDDATVEVENIHRNRRDEPRLAVAILNSAEQVATPALATTLTVCIVFFPVVLLTGPARSLFVPLALAVVISMMASYLLSRTLVPAMAHLLMKNEPIEDEGGEPQGKGKGEKEKGGAYRGEKDKAGAEKKPEKKNGLLARINRARARAFERFEAAYETALRAVMAQRVLTMVVMGLLLASAGVLAAFVGLDFFPNVDTGLMKIHFRAPIGTRLEDTEVLVADVERRIRAIIPAAEIETINDNIGVPISLNYAYIPSDAIGGQDADILIDLKPGHHATDGYVRRIRAEVGPAFPGSSLYFQPADVISQVLNFGLSSAIDVQIQAKTSEQAYEVARGLLDKVKRVPGAADVHIAQVMNRPTLRVDVDRDRAAQVGLFERDVASSLLTSLSSSSLVSPSFWVSPENNVNYTVAVQTPINRLSSFDDLRTTPLSLPMGSPGGSATDGSAAAPTPNNAASGSFSTALNGTSAPYLGSVATFRPVEAQGLVNHYTVQPIVDIQCSVVDRDLGSVARDLGRLTKGMKLPAGVEIHLRGQSQQMFQSFGSLALGLVVAILLVYLLLVTLLQSWLDPFIIMTAIPGAMVGVLWMLALTGTTLNVESLMGSIMVVGIAVSNSNLLVNFANDLRGDKDKDAKKKKGEGKDEKPKDEKKPEGDRKPEAEPEKGAEAKGDEKGKGKDEKKEDPDEAFEAAVEAGRTRLRPVLMTAIAMIIGMVPMALALGEGGEQNAPLGRAVIGGLLVATFVTLFLVPTVYTLLRQKKPQKQQLDEKFEAETAEGASDEQPA